MEEREERGGEIGQNETTENAAKSRKIRWIMKGNVFPVNEMHALNSGKMQMFIPRMLEYVEN